MTSFRPSDEESFLLSISQYIRLYNLLENRGDVETEIANTENQKRPAPRSQSRLVGVENSADHIAQSAGHSSAAKSILSYSQEPLVRGSRSSAFDAGKANRRNHQEDSTSIEAIAVNNTLHKGDRWTDGRPCSRKMK